MAELPGEQEAALAFVECYEQALTDPVRLADWLRTQCGAASSAKLDLGRVAAELGCQVHEQELPAGIEADLVPGPGDRFAIHVDPRPRDCSDSPCERSELLRRRTRFRVAHELAHTFFYRRRSGRPQRRRPWVRSEEAFCDQFANALLVPRREAQRVEPLARSVFALASRFDVSVEVAARALATSHDVEAALWFWTREQETRPEDLLRQWTTAPASLRAWRTSPLVKRALTEGSAQGSVPALAGSGVYQATAHRNLSRRQLVVVAAS